MQTRSVLGIVGVLGHREVSARRFLALGSSSSKESERRNLESSRLELVKGDGEEAAETLKSLRHLCLGG